MNIINIIDDDMMVNMIGTMMNREKHTDIFILTFVMIFVTLLMQVTSVAFNSALYFQL